MFLCNSGNLPAVAPCPGGGRQMAPSASASKAARGRKGWTFWGSSELQRAVIRMAARALQPDAFEREVLVVARRRASKPRFSASLLGLLEGGPYAIGIVADRPRLFHVDEAIGSGRRALGASIG